MFGSSMVGCDFNGDGIQDLAVGAPFEDVLRSGAIVSDAGMVNVIYGKNGTTQVLAPQVWHQDSPSVPDSVEAGDRFGTVLAAGDFDDNFFCDLAIGVPFEDIGADADAGGVLVLYGTPTGLKAISTNDSPAAHWFHQDTGLDGSAEPGDLFGAALAVGHFDLDSAADLAIGVPGEDVVSNTVVDGGWVHVVGGRGFVGLDNWHHSLSQESFGRTSQTKDHFGAALAAGNFDVLQGDDLAIGVPDKDFADIVDAGYILVAISDGTKLITKGGWLHIQQGNFGPEGLGVESGDKFGEVLTTGDFNKDGAADLAIGVWHEDVGTASNAGYVNVIYGKFQDGFTTPIQYFEQAAAGVGSVEAGDWFSRSLLSADINADGFSDLVIGVPGEAVNSNAVAQAGQIHVLFGSTGGITITTPAPKSFHPDNPSQIQGVAEANDRFGWALAAGDFNASNAAAADIAVGSPYENLEKQTGTLTDAGVVHILLSTGANGITTTGNIMYSQDDVGEVAE
jgi:hypothetical protein